MAVTPSTPYSKPFKSVDEQLDLLASRGLTLGDRAEAREHLRRVGYYRLSGYWYPLRESIKKPGQPAVVTDQFVTGATLANVIDIYQFDRKLRLLTLDAIEKIEVSIRFHVGHTLGRHGAFAHADPSVLDAEFAGGAVVPPPGVSNWLDSEHRKWLENRTRETTRSKADFVTHFKKKYGLPLPVWVITELLDFGGLSMLYGGMLQKDRDAIAAQLGLFDRAGVGNSGALKDWLKNLNYVRNVCAHHARFWNANVTQQMSPRLLSSVPELAHITAGRPLSRPYASLAVIAVLVRRINPNDDWPQRLRHLVLSELPPGRRADELGFPAHWDTETIWSVPAQTGPAQTAVALPARQPTSPRRVRRRRN